MIDRALHAGIEKDTDGDEESTRSAVRRRESIVTAKNENKCRLKIVCLGRIARRLLVFEDEDWICEKFLASFSTLDSALQRYMPRTEGARDRRF